MATDLRSWWATATPRQRDAKVAESLGLLLYEWVGRLVPHGRSQSVHEKPLSDRVALKPIPWSSFDARWINSSLYTYSTSWEHAGPLLDRLRTEGWRIKIEEYPPGCSVTIYRPMDRDDLGPAFFFGEVNRVVGATYPEAIALAFCIARGVQP